ncbi:hypothetical protein MMC06_002279 [Schaereria dolodes]|nr:hypothetical protein [Schaereria dolodes]
MSGSASRRTRLVHSHDGAEDLLFRANALLAGGEAEQALSLYTRVLYDVSRGHVCAFLNRSLAYGALGYPELAAADAYRAALATHDLREALRATDVEEKRFSAISRYLRAEGLHQQSGELWTSTPDCYIGKGWLAMPLACLLIATNVEPKNRKQFCDKLELRAIFRMAGSLWQCGLGALSDALGLIEDAMVRYQMSFEERTCFVLLGDYIMEDIEGQLGRGPATPVKHSTQSSAAVEMNDQPDHTGAKAIMAAKVTLVTREIYPWNSHEPDTSDSESLEALVSFVDDVAKGSALHSTKASPDQSATLCLMAATDIYSHETVLVEDSILQVTTASPVGTKGFYCDVCAGALITGKDGRARFLANKPRSWVSGASAGSKDTYATEKLSSIHYERPKEDTFFPQIEDYVLMAASQNPTVPPAPPPHLQLDVMPDFQFCKSCHEIPTCSTDCLAKSGEYHAVLCGTAIEQDIRSSYIGQEYFYKAKNFASLNMKLFPHPKTRCLYDLLLVRILALAANRDMNPLDLDEVRYLNGDLRSPYQAPNFGSPSTLKGKGKGKAEASFYPSSPPRNAVPKARTLPWSFTTNIIRPIHYLKEVGVDPVMQLDTCDGWVINTLLAKIMHSARITKGVRHFKRYDEDGKSLVRLGLEGTGDGVQSAKMDEDVWVGTIHTVFSLISIADLEKGDVPNITIKDNGVIRCFPVISSDYHKFHGSDTASRMDLEMKEYGKLEKKNNGERVSQEPKSPASSIRLPSQNHCSHVERHLRSRLCISANSLIVRPPDSESLTAESLPASQKSIESWMGDIKEEYAYDGNMDVDMKAELGGG